MSWYLSRGGAVEGPLEEQAIVSMIQSGQLKEGNVCAVGSQEWKPLAAHPPFGAALAAPGQTQVGGPPPAAAFGPGPVGATVSDPGAVPAMGSLPPAASPPMGAPAPAGGGAKSKLPMIVIGALAGVLVLVGVVWGAMKLFGASPQLAGYVPKDTELLFEIPSVKKALGGFRGQAYVDREELDEEKLVDDTLAGFSKAFDLTDDEAKDVLGNVESIGVAFRNLDKRAEGCVLVKFGSNKAIETLLEAKRIKKDGKVGDAPRYVMKHRELDFEKRQKLPFAERGFSEMGIEGEKHGMVWFESKKLIAIGDLAYIEDVGKVVDGGKDSLKSVEAYKDAKFDSGANAVLWVDTEVFTRMGGERDQKTIKRFFEKTGGMAASAKFVSAGMLVSLRGKLAGDAIDKDVQVPKPSSFGFDKRIPSEAFVYAAFASKQGDGKKAKDQILKSLEEGDSNVRKEAEKGIEEMEKKLGVKLTEVIEMFGDQGAMALLASHDFKFDPAKADEKDLLKHFGFVYLQELNGDDGVDTAERLLKKARKEVFEGLLKDKYKVKSADEGEGFNADPTEDGAPHVRVLFDKKVLLVAAGSKSVMGRVEEAFHDKTDVLADDKAYKKAVGALSSKPHMLLWLDTGRILRQVIKAQPKIDEEMKKAIGVSVKAIKVEEDERITTAMSLRVDVDGKVLSYSVEALNPLGLSVLGGLAFMSRAKF